MDDNHHDHSVDGDDDDHSVDGDKKYHAIIPIMMMMMTGKQSNKQLRFTERGEEPGGAQE